MASHSSKKTLAWPLKGGLKAIALSIYDKAVQFAEDQKLDLLSIEALTKEGRRTLLVTVDRPGHNPKGSAVTLEDCGTLSKRISALLDEMYPGNDSPDYTLEVSSPGLDRPIKKEAELVRYAGRLLKLTLRQGTRTATYIGRVKEEEGAFVLQEEALNLKGAKKDTKEAKEPISFFWEEVVKCRLVPEL
ncbi:MAG: hypothetical protein LBE38_03685 [Deltaproteobacteria bacterium]|jgi:ribosome maturation factor RimP|nr:hypothetical protein [Deltaproteobacteria bacterium]